MQPETHAPRPGGEAGRCGEFPPGMHPYMRQTVGAQHHVCHEPAGHDGPHHDGKGTTWGFTDGGEAGRLTDADRDVLTPQKVSALVGDDIEYWLGNPFMDSGLLVRKVCSWVVRAREEGRADVVPARRLAEVEDLRSRLACVAEATYWDRPYDERIAAIRGMCDLTTNGLTPYREGGDDQ